MLVSINPINDLIHDKLAFEQATRNGQINAIKARKNVLSNSYAAKEMKEIADKFTSQTPAAKGKFSLLANKALSFIKSNKKAFAIGAAVTAGITAIGVIAKKAIANKNEKQS